MTAAAVPAKPKRPRLTETLRSLGQPRVALMAALGFASGLPFLLTAATLGYWLRDEGTSLKAIGFLSLVGLAYSVKFLWAPVVDRVPAPLFGRLGQRRGWVLLTQVILGCGLLIMALTGPKAGLVTIGLAALLVAAASATQDIAIDALRIESAENSEELGLFSGAFQLGYRVAVLVSDSAILFAAQHLGWPTAYGLMALLMGVGIWATFQVGEPIRVATVREPAADRLNRGEFWLFTAFLALGALIIAAFLGLLVWIHLMSVGAVQGAGLIIGTLFAIPICLLGVRRCHDRGQSALLFLPALFPLLAGFGWALVALFPGIGRICTSMFSAMGVGVGALAVELLASAGFLWWLVDLGMIKGAADANRFGPAPPTRDWPTILWKTFEPVVGPLVAFFRTHGIVALLMLGMIILYRLPEFVMGPMATPFYHDLGLNKDVVGAVRLSFGLAGTLAGMAVGGFLAATLGNARGLVISGLLQALAISSFALPALFGADSRLFGAVMFMDNFGVGAAGVALVTYMSSVTSLGYTATQYALLSSAYTWVGKTLKGFSGTMVDAIHAQGHSQMESYAIYFVACGLLGVPAILLCIWLAVVTPRFRVETGAEAR